MNALRFQWADMEKRKKKDLCDLQPTTQGTYDIYEVYFPEKFKVGYAEVAVLRRGYDKNNHLRTITGITLQHKPDIQFVIAEWGKGRLEHCFVVSYAVEVPRSAIPPKILKRLIA